MIAALIPLLPLLAPLGIRVAEWLGGDDAEDVARQVTTVVNAVAGSTDTTAVAAALADPQRAAEMAVALARISAEREKAKDEARNAHLVATLADTADARRQTVQLATAGSPLAYGAPLVSAVVMALFSMMVAAEQFGWSPVTDGTKRLVEAALVLVLGYWVGSSAGSAAKDSRQAAMVQAVAEVAPAARRLFGNRTL